MSAPQGQRVKGKLYYDIISPFTYFYVKQRHRLDSKIDIEALEDWHRHCTEQGYSYNRVIDYDTSVEEILRDVAAAGAGVSHVAAGIRQPQGEFLPRSIRYGVS